MSSYEKSLAAIVSALDTKETFLFNKFYFKTKTSRFQIADVDTATLGNVKSYDTIARTDLD